MRKLDTLHGSLILADNQMGGRGQHNRTWKAIPNENLTFSLILEPSGKAPLAILTLACALAIVDVCGEKTKHELSLKWPNDVLFKEKKLSGLLTEAIFNGTKLDRVIIGIGINVNQDSFDSELAHSATSLVLISKKEHSREELLAQILTRLEYYYRLWSKKDIGLLKSINQSLTGYGSWVKINVNGEDIEGSYKFLGINENGELVVLNKELEVDTFSYEQIRIIVD